MVDGPLQEAKEMIAGYTLIQVNSREEALAGASGDGNLAPFERLLDTLRWPYDAALEMASCAERAPASVTACYQTFCGT